MLARNSLQYAFISGASLWSDNRKFNPMPQCIQDLEAAKVITTECRQFHFSRCALSVGEGARAPGEGVVSKTSKLTRYSAVGSLRSLIGSLMRVLIILCTILFIGSAFAQDKPLIVGHIEFFGYAGLNLERIRAALPLREGDALAVQDFPATKEKINQSVKRETDHDTTSIAFTCCDAHGNLMIFVGLAGASTRPPKYSTTPKGSAQLPRSIRDLYERAMDLNAEAVQKQPGEDRSKGYGLSAYTPTREVQLSMRRWALRNTPLIRRVLISAADSSERQAAAYALGYALQSRIQISALVQASHDVDDTVRNNAVRALAVLASSSDRVSTWIPAQDFAQMLHSGIWEDRNKAGALLNALSSHRNPELLRMLRSEALDALLEMAHWRNSGHASDALMILGRIAGIEEGRLQQLAAAGDVDTIVQSLKGKTGN